ncbi:DNA topoisomerase 2-binding protein 1-like isoform X2 [Homarus americanus]|uniref:DNA topoisomerase 2-binding protein 1-like isoform X2 n=1 Tax=Homarus americanus TaxID=6706 RepID=UPI001C454DF8|nr:DNA topoisomerase 2-binding protein 1-like isoform X2 [Homarus americanus]
MENASCSGDVGVNLYFILPSGLTEETCSSSLICAFQECHENNLNPEWITTDDCLKITPIKKDVFIIDPFEGEAFNYLTSGFKCVVLGPRCILSSLHRKESIPELPSPIHNTAMKDLVITATGFEKETKTELQMLVERMAGIYSNIFHEGVTHLVANAVGSKKYCVAVQKEIPVMTGEWVKAVWKAVHLDFQEDISATDQQFLSYVCPVFKGLVISVSQLQRKQKEAIRKIIEENGGTYSPLLEMSVTSVLIIPTPEGDKYSHARNWRIQCLTPDWIYDSVEQGSALDMVGYTVIKRGASTPTHDATTSMPPDISMCSTIMNETCLSKTMQVNETVQMNETLVQMKAFIPDNKGSRGLEAVESLDLQQALKAGLFLDGCKIFLSGFGTSHMEKLRRVLNTGGATRFNHLTESVSHIVIGKTCEEVLNIIQTWASKPHVIYADWIIESIKLKRPADEAPFAYLVDGESCASPHIAVKITRHSSDSLPNIDNETYVDEEILHQYLKTSKTNDAGNVSMSDTANISSVQSSQASVLPGIFSGKVFTVSGFDEETAEDIALTLQDHGGVVVCLSHRGRVHYSLLNIDGTGSVHYKAKEIISIFFIEDCIEQKKLIPVDYFHMPIHLPEDLNILADCNVTISTYKGNERYFLENIATALGAGFQEVFVRRDIAAKNARAATHLICPVAEGDKYNAAVRWGVPAVTSDWLLQCVKSKKRESEDLFKVSNKNQPELDKKALIKVLLEVSGDGSEKVRRTATDEEMEIAATPMNKKVRALREQCSLSPSKIKTPDPETFRKLYPTPGVSKPHDSLSEMPTPDTPYGSTWYPNPSSRIRKGFKRLIESMPDPAPAKRKVPPGTPLEVYYKRFFNDIKDTVQNYKPKVPVWLKKGDDNNKRDKELEGESKRADDHSPLAGVIVCTARKLQDQQSDLYEAVEKLGGDYRWAYDHTVTHFIFQGRSNDTNKDFRLARDQDKLIVSPDWVWMCRDEKTRIDEVLFPHTHNPKMSLSIVSSKTTPTTKRGRPKKKNVLEATPDKRERALEETEEPGQNKDSGSDCEENMEDEDRIKAALSKQLEEIEALVTGTGSERRNSGVIRKRSFGEKLKHTPTRPMDVETQHVTVDVVESQSTAITWEDPQELVARLKLQNQLTKDTQEIINHNRQCPPEEESENDKENTPEEQDYSMVYEDGESSMKTTDQSNMATSRYIITLLGMVGEEFTKYQKIVEELGGTISLEQHYDPHCTHIVTCKLHRSGRHLGAIASGKWLLHQSFLEDSLKMGYFVEEEPYEWGNPTRLAETTPESLESILAAAARRWRMKIHDEANEETVKGAFQGMRALIHSSKDRIASFTRLIEAGGGKVIRARPPYKEVENVTHFFIEINKLPEKIDLARFASLQIPCLPPVFLNDYLTMDPLPNEMNHLIPEYKTILADMRYSVVGNKIIEEQGNVSVSSH